MLQSTQPVKASIPAPAMALETKEALDKDKRFADVFSTLQTTEVADNANPLLSGASTSVSAGEIGAVESLTQEASHSAVLAQLGLTQASDNVAAIANQDTNALTRPGETTLPGLVTSVDTLAINPDNLATNEVGAVVNQDANGLTRPGEMMLPGLVTSDDALAINPNNLATNEVGAVVNQDANGLIRPGETTLPGLAEPNNVNNTVNSPGVAVDALNEQVALPVMDAIANQMAASVAGPVVAQSAFTATAPSAASGGSPNAAVTTQWGSQAGVQSDAANGQAGFSQQGQSGHSGQGQGNPGQPNPQAMLNMAQAAQAQKAESLEQQAAAFKLSEGALSKSGQGELLTGADFATSERRSLLPSALQTIAHPVKHPQWGQALGQRVVFMANNSISQAQITLNPEKLGPMQLSLHFDQEQQLHVTMTAQNGTTRESMENAMPRLKEMLEQAGIDLGSVNVGDERQFSEQFSGESSAKSSSPGLAKGLEGEADEALVLPKVTSDNLVDYYA